ncbi:hypothetical protein HanXRQr2_Chr02g0081741 [Helianthus annuus]|uniref:Uncharacterized protein n=1 Tax=Helianthus annuus TaxID=4232 RepID=A0A251VI48_HELAN|nr:hypothetical protein HanXRQr2_Chr02g0081741 [Helianthus annuus]KAJ0605921.1 hypothetical protein HanHA300_Chr02g0068361 [Helianthus annuus]KAJ0619916.1 hypothetical protein HanHA89_Chr02g0076601 [Helianthus annuus]
MAPVVLMVDGDSGCAPATTDREGGSVRMSVGCFGSAWVTIQFNIRVSLGSGYFVVISTQFWVQRWCSVQFRVARLEFWSC